MSRKTGKAYLTSAQIYEGWKDWKRTGVVSDAWARQMMLIAREMLKMPQFSGYAADVKEEMAQEAALKILKNIHNMREEKRGSFFSYWSCCCWTAFVTYLRKHYRRINSKRKLLLDALQFARDGNYTQVRPDVIRSLEEQIEMYDAPETGAEGD